jgi:N-acetylglucosaminyldiphosphoundecaprenol N-acetyl-beta-D-mannosaminyltransferase
VTLPRKRAIAGVEVSITDYEEVLDAIDAATAGGSQIAICCSPASSLIFARDDERAGLALANAEIVPPDGMGVVYAAKLLGEDIGDRVYGPDLMRDQLKRAAAAGTPTFLYGGFDEAALVALTEKLVTDNPGLKIAGGISPPHRPPTQEERVADAQAINDSGAQIVWVGLGSPKQEIWIDDNRRAVEAPVLVAVGAAFDFAIGRVAQAPPWMQKRGLEWLFRIIRDPIRLGKRYALTLPKFVVLVLAQRVRGQ